MRTKTLLLTAAFGAAGLATSMAQEVFSVNSVGYVNRAVPVGFSLIANPLDNDDNTIPNLFAGAPEGTTIFKFDPAVGAYTVNAFEFDEWSDPNQTLVPGEGAFIRNPTESEFTITFVGEVMQGALSNPIPQGFSIRSSIVPQSGGLETQLGYPVEEGDTIFLFDNAANLFSTHSFEFDEWSAEPVPEVAEAFFVRSPSDKSWDRDFDVNNP